LETIRQAPLRDASAVAAAERDVLSQARHDRTALLGVKYDGGGSLGLGEGIWKTGYTLGMFCDPYIADTDLEGGGGAYASGTGGAGEMPSIVGIIQKILAERRPNLTLFDTAAFEAVRKFLDISQQSVHYCGSGPTTEAPYLDGVHRFRELVESMSIGDTNVWSAGWSHPKGMMSHCIQYHLEKTAGKEFKLTVSNAGAGLQYHGGSPNEKAYPKCRSKPLTMWRIPQERLNHPAFLYMWGKIAAEQEDFHDGALCYESLIGHLCGGSTTAHASIEVDKGADYMSGQKAGTCYFKGPLKGMRYTLRRCGLSVDQFKQLWAEVRIESIAQMAGQISHPDRVIHYDAVLSTDILVCEAMCRAASQIVVREASKTAVLPSVMAQFQQDLVTVQAKLAEIRSHDDAVNAPEEVHLDAGEVRVTQDTALCLLLDRGDKEPFAGDAVQADTRFSPDFLAMPTGAVSSLHAVIEELEAVLGLCNELSNTASEQVNNVPVLQLGALIEHVVLERLPLAKPEGDDIWSDMNPTKEERSRLLALLASLMRHYCAYSLTSPPGRDVFATRATVGCAIFYLYDAALRLRYSGDNEVSYKYDEGEICDMPLSLLITGSTGAPMMMPVTAGGLHAKKGPPRDLGEVTATSPMTDPRVAAKRSECLEYTASQRRVFGGGAQEMFRFNGETCAEDSTFLLSYPDGSKDWEGCQAFMLALTANLGIGDMDCPPVIREGKVEGLEQASVESLTVFERMCGWFADLGKAIPELQQCRDMAVWARS